VAERDSTTRAMRGDLKEEEMGSLDVVCFGGHLRKWACCASGRVGQWATFQAHLKLGPKSLQSLLSLLSLEG
jgi:hypothetical protein